MPKNSAVSFCGMLYIQDPPSRDGMRPGDVRILAAEVGMGKGN